MTENANSQAGASLTETVITELQERGWFDPIWEDMIADETGFKLSQFRSGLNQALTESLVEDVLGVEEL